MQKILKRSEFGLFCTIVVFALVAGFVNSAFWSEANIFSLLKSSVVMGVFALGVLLVIVSGGIDISFPAFAVFSFYITVKFLLSVNFEGSIIIPFAMAAAIGALLGLMNAFFISTFKLIPLIVTLGTGSAVTGFLRAFVGTTTLSNLPAPLIDFSRWNIYSDTLSDGSIVGLSGSILIMLSLYVIVAVFLNKTIYGRGIYALGGDQTAAIRVGFNVKKILYLTYGLTGALAGIAGIIHCSLIRLANPRDLEGVELEVIAAVVLGGASLAGGRGSVIGTLLGVLMIVMIKGSLILVGIPTDWQKIVIGLVLIVATALNAYRTKKRV